jgi:hypothetical protein
MSRDNKFVCVIYFEKPSICAFNQASGLGALVDFSLQRINMQHKK